MLRFTLCAQRFSLEVETNGQVHALSVELSESAERVARRFVKANRLGTRAESTLRDAIERRRTEWLDSALFTLPVSVNGSERAMRVSDMLMLGSVALPFT